MSAGSLTPKRPGSKPKGAVRAKSGCYTCRIRRKKCDEKPDAEGSCQTCVRLRLQCLGFGAKRPDWMREGNSVTELRGKIKGFLAQNGMIKGHSASASASSSLRSPGPLSTSGASTSASSTSPPTISLPPLQSVTAGATAGLGTPLSATSTLTPEQRSASPPSPTSSHPQSNAHDRSFPPGHVHPHTRAHYEHALGGSDSGTSTRHGGQGQPSSSASGVLVLSNGHPIPPRVHSHVASSRPSRRSLYSSGLGGTVSGTEYPHNGLDLLMGERMDSLDANGNGSANGTANGNSNTLGNSPYHNAPQLSPDSPTPSYRADPMIGGYAGSGPAPHMSGHGHGQGTGYVSVAHHPPGQFAHGRHSNGVGHSGLGGQGGHGHSHGHGQAASSSSWAGSNHVRLSSHQQHQEHLLQQQQQNQAQAQAQVSYVWTHGNHSNDSGTLHFPDASPTVRRTDLPPPSLQSSFSPLYYANCVTEDFGMDGIETFAAQQAQMNGMGINGGADEGGLLPYYGQAQAPISGMDFYALPQDQQQQVYQEYAPILPLQATLVDPLFVDRGDGSLVEHYLRYVRPVQYFFLDERLVELLRRLAIDNEAVRNAICSVASVHKRRMREGSSTPSPPQRATLALPANVAGAPVGDDGSTYYDRTRMALGRLGPGRLTKAEAMAGLQCISSFLFAGGVGGWDFFLDIACQWVETVLAQCGRAGDAHLLDTLARMMREDELGSFIVRTTMWFEVLASVTMVRAPRFLDVYRKLFSADGARVVEVDGEAAPMEAEFSMLQVMGCDNLTFLALAEISALAAWKEEETKTQTLSSVELVKRGFDIEQRYLRAIAESGANVCRDGMGLGADSLENRRRLTADIFRASARLYLHTVLSGDKPSVREIREGVRETVEALKRVPVDPMSLRRSVVRSVVFPICLAGCMTDEPKERETLRQFLVGESGAGNCGEVVKVMEAVWERRDGAQKRGRGARRGTDHVSDVSWRDVLREGGVPLLLV